MTKGEKRRLRKRAREEGKPLTGDLKLDNANDPVEFTESPEGYSARERWARQYDELNGAPEGEWDR